MAFALRVSPLTHEGIHPQPSDKELMIDALAPFSGSTARHVSAISEGDGLTW